MATSVIPEDWSALSTINPELKQLLDALPDPKFQLVTEDTTIEDLRAMGAKTPKSDPWADVLEQDEMVKMIDGFENRIRIYSPNSHSTGEAEVCTDRGKGALLVMIHGGGFCVGNLEQEERNCSMWVPLSFPSLKF
jgi:acetyl esterase/lipase